MKARGRLAFQTCKSAARPAANGKVGSVRRAITTIVNYNRKLVSRSWHGSSLEAERRRSDFHHNHAFAQETMGRSRA